MLYRIGLPFWKVIARSGATIAIPVQISFDQEANVYIATSSHLSGLAVEAPSLDELREEVRGAIDVLVEAEIDPPCNHGSHTKAAPSFRFRDRPVAIA